MTRLRGVVVYLRLGIYFIHALRTRWAMGVWVVVNISALITGVTRLRGVVGFLYPLAV